MRPILTFLFLFNAFLLYSQNDFTQTIKGRVVDKQSQYPLPGASIVVLNTEPIKGSVTDENGYFKIENISLGRQTIQISFIGYHSVTINNLLVSSGKEIILDIELEEQVLTTNEVIIKAENNKAKAINEMAIVSARSFTVEETEKYAGSLGDPSRMVSNYAGVMSVSDQRNDIIIRGNSPMGLLWRLNGIDIPNPNHFGSLGTTGGPVSMLNNNLLTNSDFYTGAFPAEYGNALSGAFDLKLRNGNSEKREYVGQVGFNGFELGAEGPISKKNHSSYIINYRYSTIDVFNKLGFDVGTGSSVPHYQDLSFILNIPTKKAGRFTLFGIGGLSSIQLYDSEKDSSEWSYGLSGTDTDFGSDMGVIALTNTYFFDEKTRLVTTLSVQAFRNNTFIDSLDKQDVTQKYPFYRAEINDTKYAASLKIKKKYNNKNNASAGVIYENYMINYIDSVKLSDDEFHSIVDVNGSLSLIQAYVEFQHKFNDKLTLYSGLHSQFFSLNNEIAIEPRLGLKWNFTPTQAINFGAGMHSQTQPRANYFYKTKLDDGSIIETNHNVKFSKSNHLVLGYDNLLTENLRIKIETYYQYLYKIPVKESSPVFSMLNAGDFFAIPMDDSIVNEGTGKNYGIELTFEKFLHKGFYFLLTTSVFDSKYKGFDRIERNTAFNGNYVFNLLAGYEFKTGKKSMLSFNLKGVRAGGKRYIPIDLEQSKLKGHTVYDWDNAYEYRYDDYMKIDARISFKVNGKKISQEWALDIQNLTNNQNIFTVSYDPISQSLKTEYQSGFYPMMLYRINF